VRPLKVFVPLKLLFAVKAFAWSTSATLVGSGLLVKDQRSVNENEVLACHVTYTPVAPSWVGVLATTSGALQAPPSSRHDEPGGFRRP
jgi:hypothetical protein